MTTATVNTITSVVQIAPRAIDGRKPVTVTPDDGDTLESLIEDAKEFARKNCAYDAHVMVDGAIVWANYSLKPVAPEAVAAIATAEAITLAAEALPTVFEGLQAYTLQKGLKALATEQNTSVAVLKARNAQNQGASGALLAASGINRAANIAESASKDVAFMVNRGTPRYAACIATVCAAYGKAFTYSFGVHSDGTQSVKRAEWVRLHDTINTDASGGKAGASRKAKALVLWATIQAAIDNARAPAPMIDSIKASLEA